MPEVANGRCPTISRPRMRARGDPLNNTRSTRPRRSSTPRDFFRDAHRRIFEKMVTLTDRSEPVDLVTLKDELGRVGRARRRRRPGLHRGAHRRRAAVGQRRVLREDRQGKVDAPPADSVGEQDLGRAYDAEEDADDLLDEAERSIFADRRRPAAVGVRAARRAGRSELPDHREARAASRPRHRRADRLRRSRRDDLGLPAVGPRHHRRPSVDGEDRASS